MTDAVKRVEEFLDRTSGCDEDAYVTAIIPNGSYADISIGDIRAIIEENKRLREAVFAFRTIPAMNKRISGQTYSYVRKEELEHIAREALKDQPND